MALNDMPAEPAVGPHGPFEVDDGSFPQSFETCAVERFAGHFSRERVIRDGSRRKANTVDCYAGADPEIVKYSLAGHINRSEIASVFDSYDLTDFFNDPCEHMQSRRDRARISPSSNLGAQ